MTKDYAVNLWHFSIATSLCVIPPMGKVKIAMIKYKGVANKPTNIM